MVSAAIASVVQAMGIDVGLYTSPHLIRFNERICINGESASDDELVAALVDRDGRGTSQAAHAKVQVHTRMIAGKRCVLPSCGTLRHENFPVLPTITVYRNGMRVGITRSPN